MRYGRLTREDRYQIEALLDSGHGIRKIARQLKRDACTISREVKRGLCKNGNYSASKADEMANQQLHRPHCSVRKIQKKLESYVRHKLELDWSPEQIAGRMKAKKRSVTVSHMTIYRYLERDKTEGGKLWKHLRILRKQRKNRKAPQWHPHCFLPERVPISKRPKVVEVRKRLGDYERDTVLGKRGGAVLLTIVDRKSRVLSLDCLRKSTAKGIHKSTVSLLRDKPKHTITNDNGFEFSHHAKTANRLNVKVYFSNSYRAWERGTNENTNGLLRQYFPKKTAIGPISKKQLKAIERRINTRPRKILGYRTPLEVQKQLLRQVLR